MRAFLLPGIVFAILIALASAWYFSGEGRGNGEAVSAPELHFAEAVASSTTPLDASPPSVPDGWKKYENGQYGFSLFVPPNLSVNTFDEGAGASTFTFEDDTTMEGFQIFVVPYSGASVSRERFYKDAPSGVMKEPVDVVIGGITATAFFGEQSLMGETREVWFIRNNFLFEVTTYKKYDTWLAQIMGTWRFTR